MSHFGFQKEEVLQKRVPAMPKPGVKEMPSFSQKLQHHASLPGAGIEIDENDLLPGAQEELPVGKGRYIGRANECRPKVSSPVVITPGLIVLIVLSVRSDLAKHILYVMVNQARLVFHRRNAGRRTNAKDSNLPFPQACFGQGLPDSRGKVNDVGMPFRREFNGLGKYLHYLTLINAEAIQQ